MNLTETVIIASVVILLAFDVWVIVKKGKQESISAYLIRGSREYTLAVLLFGMLLGHVFWSMNTEDIYYNTKCIKVEEK